MQADFRGDVVSLSKTIAEEQDLYLYELFRIFPHTHHKWYHVYQTCHKAVYCQACWRLCLKITLLLMLNLSDILKLDIPL